MGRIQHSDNDDSRSYSYSPSPRDRRPKGKTKKKAPAKEPSPSPPPKARRRRKESSSPPPRKRDAAPEVKQPDAPAIVPVAHPAPQAPSNPGVPNIAALTSSIGADLGTARSLAGFLQPGGLNLTSSPSLGGTSLPTTQMDFSKPKKDLPTVKMDVQKSLVPLLMTPDNKQLLTVECGATIEWDHENAKVILSGSTDQLQRAQRLLNRIRTQCCWGQSEDKVRRLIKPKKVKSVRCRLSPMEGLPQCEKTLSAAHPMIKMGKGQGGENHLILPNPHRCVSRTHCIIEFDEERGGVYIHDCSTNGTFLNNIKLPPQSGGKVLLSHGDELLFKDPRDGKTEFGYIVSLYDIVVQEEMTFSGPRRLLSTEEMNMYPTRDYNPY